MNYYCWLVSVLVNRFNHHFFKYLSVVLNSSSSLLDPHSNPDKYYTWMPDITAYSVQFSWFAQSCPTLCIPMDCSMPGFPASPTPRACSNSCPLSWWCHPTISSSVVPFTSHLQSFPGSGSFPVSQSFTSSSQSIGVSVPASVLPMNIQGWFPLGLTGLISLQSKGPQKSFPTPQFKSINSLMLSPILTSIHDYWKNHRFD